MAGGSFSFSVIGTAAGPFPGTFTESGTFTADESGALTDFSSTFTITNSSGTVTVTGSKSLVGTSSRISCSGGDLFTVNNFTTSYTATINCTGADKGAATVNIAGLLGPPKATDFSEMFGSTGVVQKQCKHGGWKSFGTFTNQGECVSFFATGGKNPPAGS